MNNLLIHKAHIKEEKAVGEDGVFMSEGYAVFDLLYDKEFQDAWDKLYENCAWATVFQKRTFVTSWYQIYSKIYLPLIIYRVGGGRLTGILTLTKSTRGLITGAGAAQAEYQVWLTSSDDGGGFIKQALSLIRKRYPKDRVQLKYIPGKAYVAWAKTDSYWSKRCFLRAFRQPLILADEEKLLAELRKKNRREKINRLKRLGELEFKRIKDCSEFTSIFDELALQFDFRKEAMFNRSFFRDDSYRKDFLVSLFKNNLLHVTVLKVNGEVIASNVGAVGKGSVHLQGINSHAPSYARYSPGILHFLMLGRLLSEEGILVFDLTPGADAYKDALATDYAEAYQIDVVSRAEKLEMISALTLVGKAKATALRLGVKPEKIKGLKYDYLLFKERLEGFKKLGLGTVLSNGYRLFKGGLKEQVYLLDETMCANSAGSAEVIKCCSLNDLLAYAPASQDTTRWDFLKEAMRKLENGEQSYTWCREGRLIACAWYNVSKEANMNTPLLKMTHWQSESKDDFMIFGSSMLATLKCNQLYISIDKNNILRKVENFPLLRSKGIYQ
ncbi:GNAT family N-acetyltransferase [Pontibacter korlensis]|uniref:BioF2-like acetyltransferase domain-containing protein n=1 Tax=Pontibacter korlensis TaxID=400092 RepID=A0A0E3ZFN8_9BACT|nr:GNAT family N-acetyltransferase [Pontibacter korlensis]AKD04395.1 hypothetical protein PKOR_16515 [Pontibacter korlensis]